MKQKKIISLIVFLLLVFACEKETERIENLFVDFATVSHLSSQIAFKLDNNRLLIPKETVSYEGNEGQRVILNYTPLSGDTIKVNQISDIHTDEVKEFNDIDFFEKDPVKIQSVWVSGDYLNFILEIEYYSQLHKIGVVRNSVQSSSDLYFVHSRENDPPGYAKKMYASFLLTPLKTGSNIVGNFKIHIETINGERTFEFEY